MEIVAEQPNVLVNFNKKDTVFNINQIIRIKRKSTETRLDYFVQKSEVRFSDANALAKEL